MIQTNSIFDKINFSGGNLSSDGGSILITQFLEQMKFKEFCMPGMAYKKDNYQSNCLNLQVVRVKGLEPPRRRRQILSLVRLPISPHPHFQRAHL